MSIEQMDQHEAQEQLSIKEELGGLKGAIEYKTLQENPKKALLLWFANSGKLPVISDKVDVDAKKRLFTPSIVEDTNFKKIVSSIKETMSFRTSLHSIEQVLAQINLPTISAKYVTPDGDNVVMKFKFENNEGNISLTPFVKGDSMNGFGLDVDTSSKYTVTSKLTKTGDRKFSFMLKE